MKKKHATRTTKDYISQFNRFKAKIAKTPGPPVPEWKPLRPTDHPRAAEMRKYAAIPSRWC